MGGDSLLFGLGKDHANLSQLDPWELPPYFLLRKNKQCKSLRTYCGYWKEKDEELTAIRSAEELSSSSSSATPSYVGVRKTLEFYLKDGTRGGEGTKTDWIIHEYHHLRKDDAGEALFLEEDVVLRKVFKKGQTDQAPSCAEYPCVMAPSIETSEGLNQDLGAHYHPDGKSEGLNQDFTRIRTDDPNVVLAACHHCDEVLEAHPEIHGNSPLQRHRNSVKCRSSCGNPSTDEEREMLHRLRTKLDTYKQQKIDGNLECQEVNAHLTQLNPWVLRDIPWYVTTSLNRQTNVGCWEEIDEEFTGIRMEQSPKQGCWTDIDNVLTAIQNDYQMQMQVPQYMGLRRTLEFHLNLNGNKLKTGWIMLEYQQVIESPELCLEGDMVIRKVLPYDKGAVTAIFSDFGRKLNGDNDNEERNNGEGVNTEITTPTEYMNGGGEKKRKRCAASKRTSKVWICCTEIRTADRDVVYAVCHHCDRGYSARSKNGTSHLRRHTNSCNNKLRRTENANDITIECSLKKNITIEWHAEIWPRFLVLKNYLETEHQASGTC